MPNRTFSSGQGHLVDIIMFPLSLSLCLGRGLGSGFWTCVSACPSHMGAASITAEAYRCKDGLFALALPGMLAREARNRLQPRLVSEIAKPGGSLDVELFEGIPCELSGWASTRVSLKLG